MQLTKREEWALRYLLDFPVLRYMICNSKGRTDDHEKADLHIEMSQNICMFILCEGRPRHENTLKVRLCTMVVHDYLAEILTDRMDEAIFYPFDKQMYGEDFEYYKILFIDYVINHLDEIENVINEELKQSGY